MRIGDVRNKLTKTRRIAQVSRRFATVNTRFTSVMGSTAVVSGALAIGAQQFLSRFQSIYYPLQAEQASLQQAVQQLPPGDLSLRNQGVGLAWKYERGLLQLGGSGTRDWSSQQVEEIIRQGRLRGMHGHHINDASSNPSSQADADNIRFVTPEEHLDAHGGNWRNPTSGELVDRSVLMRRLLIKSELKGLGTALVVGFTITTVLTLFDNTLSGKERLEFGIDGLTNSGISYVASRLTGVVLSGMSVSQVVKMAGIGVAASIGASLYTYIRLRRLGADGRKAFKSASSQLGVSLVGIFLTSLAQYLWGGPAGIITGLAFAGLILLKNVIKRKQQESLVDRLQCYTISLLEPKLGLEAAQ